MKRWLPWLTFAFFCSLSLFLWQEQDQHAREMLLRHTETSAEQLRVRIEGLMNARIAALELLADRWVEREPPDFSFTRFHGFAETLMRRYPGFHGIFWLNPEGQVTWVFPEADNADALGLNLHAYEDARYAAVLNTPESADQCIVMPSTPLKMGGIGFHVLRPLIYNGRLQGFLDGLFRLDNLMALSLPESVARDFSVKLLEEDRQVFSLGQEDPEWLKLSATRQVRFGGKVWTLELAPRESTLNDSGNIAFLIFGLVVSGSLALLLYFLFERMEMFRESRDEALHEVRERQRAEAALRENEKTLESLLSELSAKNAELESFVYTVSHDLKTPIVTIEGFIGALREDFGHTLTDDGHKYLGYMSDATRKMELLISDLLNLSRIGRLTEPRVAVPMAEIAAESVASLRHQIDTAGVVVEVQGELPIVWGERKRLVQVMDNLLSNAIKYLGRDNPAPKVTIGCLKEGAGPVLFVRDNGIGIEPRYFEKVFQIFERLPAAKRLSQGTGIGLTIVKRIIEHHGSRIWLDSEPGKGSTFFFTLPEEPAQVPEAATSSIT